MSDHPIVRYPNTEVPEGVPSPGPDEENPAVIDALKTFKITMVGAALYVGAVIVYIFLL